MTTKYTYAIYDSIERCQKTKIVSINDTENLTDPIEFILGPTEYCYAGLVNKLVSYKYPNERMQAIINNYLLDPNDESANQEFIEMQKWRSESKEIAKEILEKF